MANSPVRHVYWDSCTFIGLLNEEPDKVDDCRKIWEEAELGRTIIHTSTLTWVEVFRVKCDGMLKPLAEAKDAEILAMLQQPWIRTAIVDQRTAIRARHFLRMYPECKKPMDGVHLAAATIWNAEQLHTFDGSDLIKITGKVYRDDGKLLEICRPTPLPAPPPPPPPAQRLITLFDEEHGN